MHNEDQRQRAGQPARRTGRFDRDHRRVTRSEVMTAAEVAQLLRTPKTTVEEWARRGKIPSRKRGRRRLFLRWEVEDWLLAEDE